MAGGRDVARRLVADDRSGSTWAGGSLGLLRRPALGFLGASFFLILAPDLERDSHAERGCRASDVPTPYRRPGGDRHGHQCRCRPACSPRGPSFDAAKAARGLAFAALCLLLGSLTFRRNIVYRSTISLWENTVANAPLNVRP